MLPSVIKPICKFIFSGRNFKRNFFHSFFFFLKMKTSVV